MPQFKPNRRSDYSHARHRQLGMRGPPGFGGDTLMCLVQVAMDEIVRSVFWKMLAEAVMYGFIA